MPPPAREARIPGYDRRDPTRTPLYELLAEHTETFLAELDALPGSGLPRFVRRELRGFLDCGVLAHGFARAQGLVPGALGLRTGAVNVVQRTGGSLNLNPHFAEAAQAKARMLVWQEEVRTNPGAPMPDTGRPPDARPAGQ